MRGVHAHAASAEELCSIGQVYPRDCAAGHADRDARRKLLRLLIELSNERERSVDQAPLASRSRLVRQAQRTRAREVEARVLLASTSEVYGDPLIHLQPKSYWGNVNPIGPRGVYDKAKR